jgi:hypothetical protein
MQCIPYIGWKTRGALEVGFESFSRPVDRVMHSLVGSLRHANSLTYSACSNTNLRPALVLPLRMKPVLLSLPVLAAV